MDYEAFLSAKALRDPASGLVSVPKLNRKLFDFQRDIVTWALRRGRSAIWADCGLGKTFMQLEWAKHVPGNVLILAPLAVAQQTAAEGKRLGIKVGVAKSQDDVRERITITNYERMSGFDASAFAGVVLDESSILKSHDGKTRTAIIDAFRETPFRLACTATPAPNDFMELGNHAEFLGTMTRAEMLAMFFVHDGGETQKWRLKGHAESDFWRWLASWAVVIRKPSDLGYDDGRFVLPSLSYHRVSCEVDAPLSGTLFAMHAETLQERIQARRETVDARVKACADIVNATAEPFLVWCNLNSESAALAESIPDAVEVSGSMSNEAKESAMAGFSDGRIRVLVTKPSIAGFGMNWQHCRNMAFVGLSDSYEQFYQAVRRCWRFGQEREVNAYIITADIEGAVVDNIKRKESDSEVMASSMAGHMRDLNAEALHGGTVRSVAKYEQDEATGEGWTARLGDCVEGVAGLPSNSVDFTVYSPPFASLYTYSNSERDMGNSRSDDEFMKHYGYLVADLYRVTKPGRLVSFHCMNLPTSKTNHGYIGVRDFRGELIRLHEQHGWIFHSEVCIWKDPVTAMQRTKALGLLWKQLKKDSAMSRQGIPDYLVTMRKPGENEERIGHTEDDFPVAMWQRYASPVWMDINPSDTLQHRSAREHNDERHICPLQLEVIRRAVKMWSNPGDLVLSPFMGIGSEGHVSLTMGRRFLGYELKRSYWQQACANLRNASVEQAPLLASLVDEE